MDIATILSFIGVILAPLLTVSIAWRKLSEKVKLESGQELGKFKIAELEDQRHFRRQLLDAVGRSQEEMLIQSKRILSQEEELVKLRIEVIETKALHKKCQDEFKKFRDIIAKEVKK